MQYGDKEDRLKLYDILRHYCLSAGGDGDAWLVSENYLAYADEFEADEKAKAEPWFTERDNQDNTVIFSNWQEAIFFVKDRSHLHQWAGDIIVEIH